MIKKITQSFIKDMRDYFAGRECGHIIKAKYVDDRLLEEEEPGAMGRGAYFEWLLTEKLLGEGKGTLPKSGKKPLPQYMASKVKANGGKTDGLTVADMYDDYRKVHSTVDLIVQYLKDMGLKVKGAGIKWTRGRYEGTIDLLCECERRIDFESGVIFEIGQEIVIDLKYSGLVTGYVSMSNKHGWDWSDIQKEYHGTQAKQYFYISKGKPFFFFVVQSNPKTDETPVVKMFYVPVSKPMIDQHIEEGNILFTKFTTTNEFGFVPRPSLEKCSGCLLKAECSDKQTFPHPKVVDLTLGE